MYVVAAQPPRNIREQLNRLGVDTEQLEKDDKLQIVDAYTVTLGLKSDERYSWPTLKAADASVAWSRGLKEEEQLPPDCLRIGDDHSVLARFNEEKSWVELILTRHVPFGPKSKTTAIVGYIVGVHSDWVYKRLEAAYDGIIDFRLDESSGGARDLIRIRSMRNVHFDREWYQLKVGENFEVMLER